MNDVFKGLIDFHLWCRNRGLSYSLFYGEADDTLAVEIISAAPSECDAEKRCYDLYDFMRRWEKRTKVS